MGGLTWENFERLCLRLERTNAELETCRIYGTRGQEQEGIDVYSVDRVSGKHRVLQCKRVKQFGPSDLVSAVDLFLKGQWAASATNFTLCTTFRLDSTKFAEKIEAQRERLREMGIGLEIWDASELEQLLKNEPDIVDDFFGRSWATAFCPAGQMERLKNRTTGPDVADMRIKLRTLYTRVFAAHDPGFSMDLGNKVPVALRDRYVLPDVYEDRVESLSTKTDAPQESSRKDSNWKVPPTPTANPIVDILKQRRSLRDWLSEQPCRVLLGGPGLGKSTTLRFIALDSLSENPTLTQPSAFHDTYLPVWISFPFWTAKIADSTDVIGIPDIIRSWLRLWTEDRLWPLFEQALADERLLLLVDGLDEYRNEDSARTGLAQLKVFSELRNCRVITTARPAGYDRLAVHRTGWPASSLAELTKRQQEQYATHWYTQQREMLTGDALSDAENHRVVSVVASFMAEMRSSADLGELAKTPLLLALLLYLKSSSIPLPNSRYRAYGRLVEHLISVHPIARRLAAMTNDESSDLTPEDARVVFAHLAFHLQSDRPEGLIDRKHAEETIGHFLRDEVLGFGLGFAESRKQARSLLTFGEQSLGLLVERGPQELGFLHKSFQEYLAAEHLARQPFVFQSNFVKQHCAEPLWQEVLLSLVHLNKRPEEVTEFVEVIRNNAQSVSDRFVALPILCEIAVGDFQCAVSLARKLCTEVIEEIEQGPWKRLRERLLKSLLVGLFSPRVKDMIQSRIRAWIPGRTWRNPAVMALVRGSQSPDVIDCLFRLLIDEDDYINVQAGQALAALVPTNPQVADRLVALLRSPYSVQTEIAALNALLTGSPDHPEWPRIVAEIEKSPSMDLRMIAIQSKIRAGSQTVDDRDQILSWAERRGGMRLLYGGSLADILLKGWPGDPLIKRKAIEAFHNVWPDDEQMDQEIALIALAQGFIGDEDALKAIGSLIREKKKDYLWIQYGGWLYERLKGIPEIIEAVDEWLAANDSVMTREVSMFARIGWTDVGKQRLMEGLKNSHPFWCAEALLDHWGMSDSEVSTALIELANSNRGAEIGYLLPRIIEDLDLCQERLMSLLRDPGCHRSDHVLLGLALLGNSPNRDEIVDAAMPFTERETLWDSRTKDILFAHFSDCDQVRKLARKQLTMREGSLASVAEFFGGDPSLRSGVIAALTPLPAHLRETIVAFLCDHRNNLPWAQELFAEYDLEADPSIKTQMAIAHYQHLVDSKQDLANAKARLMREIVTGGADHMERRQAAYCGLFVIGSLADILTMTGIYHPGPPHTGLYNGLKINYAMIQFLLENWVGIRNVLGEGFWPSISDFNKDRMSIWGILCLLADNYPGPRAEALDFIRGERASALQSSILEFVARVQPRSPLLRELCLNCLFERSSHSENDPERAIALLSRDFAMDAAVREALDAKLVVGFSMYGARAMWALCELDPQNPVLRQEMDQFRVHLEKAGDWVIQSSYDMALICAVGTTEEVFSVLRFILRGCRPNYRYFAQGFERSIVGRVTTDTDLQDKFRQQLKATENPSERGSFLALLVSVAGLTPELRDFSRALCETDADSLVAQVGMSIRSGLLSPVAEFAANALLGI